MNQARRGIPRSSGVVLWSAVSWLIATGPSWLTSPGSQEVYLSFSVSFPFSPPPSLPFTFTDPSSLSPPPFLSPSPSLTGRCWIEVNSGELEGAACLSSSIHPQSRGNKIAPCYHRPQPALQPLVSVSASLLAFRKQAT